jgi:hypothetical protein
MGSATDRRSSAPVDNAGQARLKALALMRRLWKTPAIRR